MVSHREQSPCDTLVPLYFHYPFDIAELNTKDIKQREPDSVNIYYVHLNVYMYHIKRI